MLRERTLFRLTKLTDLNCELLQLILQGDILMLTTSWLLAHCTLQQNLIHLNLLLYTHNDLSQQIRQQIQFFDALLALLSICSGHLLLQLLHHFQLLLLPPH